MYASDGCSYCKEVKEKLNSNNIDFKVRLIDDFQNEWQQVVATTGMGMLPTLYFKDNFFLPGRNFSNTDHLIKIIKEFKKSKFSNEINTLEKIQTLSYNMGMAFNKMHGMLDEIKNQLKIEDNEHKSTS